LKNCRPNQDEIQIADFGCGDMQFANFFFEEIEKKPELAETKICIHAFDISTNEIPISEQLKNSEQIRIVPHPGVSCGNSLGFQTESFDFIVSTLALFGNEDSWKKSIQTAFFALKTNGLFVLVEWRKYLSSRSAQNMSTAGIDCTHFVPGIFFYWCELIHPTDRK
jgi:SAM-dependent methyltransferase